MKRRAIYLCLLTVLCIYSCRPTKRVTGVVFVDSTEESKNLQATNPKPENIIAESQDTNTKKSEIEWLINEQDFKLAVIQNKDSLQIFIKYFQEDNSSWKEYKKMEKGFGDLSNFNLLSGGKKVARKIYKQNKMYMFCFELFPGKILFVFNKQSGRLMTVENGVMGSDVIYGEIDITFNPSNNQIIAIREGRGGSDRIVDKYYFVTDNLITRR